MGPDPRARVANNLSWAFSAQVITSAFGLATLFVTTRALGPASFGILALVEAYVRIVDPLLRLEPWQVAIKYGIAALERNDEPAFLKLVKLSILAVLALVSAPLVFEMDRVIVRIFGEGFRSASPVVTVLLISAIVFLSGAVLNPALLAMGHDAILTKVTLAATVLFSVSFVPFVYMFGVAGSAASNLLFNVIWTIGCLIGFRRALPR